VIRRLIFAVIAVVVVVAITIAAAAYWFFSRDGFRRALEAQATAWSGQPVQIGAAGAQVFPRLAIQLRNIRIGESTQLTLNEVDLAADLRPLLAGRIENADVRVSGSRIDMPLPFGLPEETNGGESGATAAGAPVRIVSIRSIALRDVTIRSRDREITISADSSLDGSTLTVSSFEAKAGKTTLEADGTIGLSPRVDARLKAVADRVDVDELIALADAFTPESGGSSRNRRQPARIVASIQAGQATAGALQMQQFQTQLTLDGDALALSGLQFDMFQGRYEGSVKARLSSPLSATLDSRIRDVDVGQLAAFGGSPDSITGKLSGAGTFTGLGTDVPQLLRSARGNGTASIVDGSIRRLGLVRTVILFFGRPAPDTQESTDRFDRLDVKFSLTNRVFRAQPMSLDSRDARISGEGTLNLDADALDGRADLVLSEELSKQAGTDLARYTREGDRVVLPASIGGTLSAPRLTIDAAAALKRGLRNEVERRIRGLLP
jgi:uncharacterized protein involved in outer membrane biogenesis